MTHKTSIKQIRDRDRARLQRKLVKKHLHERRIFLNETQQELFDKLVVSLGPHIHSRAAALAANGLLVAEQRVATKTPKAGSATAAQPKQVPSDGTSVRSNPPVDSSLKQEQFLF